MIVKELCCLICLVTACIIHLYYIASSVSGWRWTKLQTVIGYPSGQDGTILHALDYLPCPVKKFPRKPNNKFFIGQAYLVKMAGYRPHSFFCEFMDLDSVLAHKHAKKELSQYHAWSIMHIQCIIPSFCTHCRPMIQAKKITQSECTRVKQPCKFRVELSQDWYGAPTWYTNRAAMSSCAYAPFINFDEIVVHLGFMGLPTNHIKHKECSWYATFF